MALDTPQLYRFDQRTGILEYTNYDSVMMKCHVAMTHYLAFTGEAGQLSRHLWDWAL